MPHALCALNSAHLLTLSTSHLLFFPRCLHLNGHKPAITAGQNIAYPGPYRRLAHHLWEHIDKEDSVLLPEAEQRLIRGGVADLEGRLRLAVAGEATPMPDRVTPKGAESLAERGCEVIGHLEILGGVDDGPRAVGLGAVDHGLAWRSQPAYAHSGCVAVGDRQRGSLNDLFLAPVDGPMHWQRVRGTARDGSITLPPPPSAGRHRLSLKLRVRQGGAAVLDRLVVVPEDQEIAPRVAR